MRKATDYTTLQSNPLQWIGVGCDYEYPPIHVLHFVLCLNGTKHDIHLGGLSTLAVSTYRVLTAVQLSKAKAQRWTTKTQIDN